MSGGIFSPPLHYDNKPFSVLGQWELREGGSLWEEGTCRLLEKTACATTQSFMDIYFFRSRW